MKSTTLDAYQKYFVDLGMERAGLFQVVQQRYNPVTVLYPGCWVHITPSFYFPHVVYVDRMPEAAQFFAGEAALRELIERRKHYRRSPYLRFIHQDYTQPLPLQEASFDLLIALYAGGIPQACTRYLRPGGLLLTNNHHDDARQAAADPALQLIATVHLKGETFTIRKVKLEKFFVPKELPRKAGRRLHPAGSYTEFTQTAELYIFRKAGRPR